MVEIPAAPLWSRPFFCATTMQVSLDFFDNDYIEAVTLCGRIAGEDNELREFVPEKASPIEICKQSVRGPVCFRLLVNRQSKPDGTHFHIDTAMEASFDTPLARCSKEEEFDRLWSIVAGRDVNYFAKGRFIVPRAVLKKNSVVNLLLGISVSASSDEACLNGSSYKLKTGPVRELQWRLCERDGEEHLAVKVTSDVLGPIEDDILVDAYEPMAAVFKALVLEEGLN